MRIITPNKLYEYMTSLFKNLTEVLIEDRKSLRKELKQLDQKINVMSGNVVQTYTADEDVHLKLIDIEARLQRMQGGIDTFLANFSVVEDIPIDEKDPRTHITEDGTTIEDMVKTVDSVKRYGTLTDIGADLLQQTKKVKIDNAG